MSFTWPSIAFLVLRNRFLAVLPTWRGPGRLLVAGVSLLVAEDVGAGLAGLADKDVVDGDRFLSVLPTCEGAGRLGVAGRTERTESGSETVLAVDALETLRDRGAGRET